MPKKSVADTPAKEKSPAKKSPKAAVKSEPKAEKKVVKKAVKAEAAADTKPKAAKKAAAEKPKAAKSTGKTKKAAGSVPPEQLEEHIRVAAYYRWEERGRSEGAHESDWIEAEKQIRK